MNSILSDYLAEIARIRATRAGPLHVAHTLAVAAVPGRYGVIVAYTTSQPWIETLPRGVLGFDRNASQPVSGRRATLRLTCVGWPICR